METNYAAAWARLDAETQDSFISDPRRYFDLETVQPLVGTEGAPLVSHTRFLSADPPSEGWSLSTGFANWIDDLVANELEEKLCHADDQATRDTLQAQIDMRRNHV